MPSEYNAVPDWYSDRSPHSNVIGTGSGATTGSTVVDGIGAVEGATVVDVMVEVVVAVLVVGPVSLPHAVSATTPSAAMTMTILRFMKTFGGAAGAGS
ncbi:MULTISPECIES: hypothetical protein [unclassified Rhodococcus (in: high G+C Gram-positive bacteria)]|uniref:hypothetical protein n=1 Tax=unclassified Rhodococcus (in: high G+C Gram-positive bacteria) TaxID=192944 RepID=UPI0012E91981|nr:MULTISPECIES: hypothetical protein [unclassified Rhodococcus (in: high G+C Gram-positive bacteria)]